jgi:hydrogenase small subunit
MTYSESRFASELERRGVSRRDFLSFCGLMASILALPRSLGAKIASAIEDKEKPTLVWLEFQDCAGNTESFLRAARPTVADIILDAISVDYHETIMAAAGHQAEEALAGVVAQKPGAYIAVVEGSIPTGANGAYCTVGGRSAHQIAREVCGSSAATIAIGTCAAFGGLPAAAPCRAGNQKPHQPPSMPGQRRKPGGGDRLLPDLQPLAANGPLPQAAVRLRQSDS